MALKIAITIDSFQRFRLMLHLHAWGSGDITSFIKNAYGDMSCHVAHICAFKYK